MPSPLTSLYLSIDSTWIQHLMLNRVVELDVTIKRTIIFKCDYISSKAQYLTPLLSIAEYFVSFVFFKKGANGNGGDCDFGLQPRWDLTPDTLADVGFQYVGRQTESESWLLPPIFGIIIGWLSILNRHDALTASLRYNCVKYSENFSGLELEDGGGRGTSGSHRKKRLLRNEIMMGSIDTRSVVSKMTLALLEDSRWYKLIIVWQTILIRDITKGLTRIIELALIFGPKKLAKIDNDAILVDVVWKLAELSTKLSKLDRFLILEDVTIRLPDVRITALDRLWSDHNPILLYIDKIDFGLTLFKLYNSWLLRDGFFDIKNESFEVSVQEIGSWSTKIKDDYNDISSNHDLKEVDHVSESNDEQPIDDFEILQTKLNNMDEQAFDNELGTKGDKKDGENSYSIDSPKKKAFKSFDLMESAAYYGEVRRFWGLDEKCGVLEEAKCALVIWFRPCLILKIAREGVRMMFTFINGGDFAVSSIAQVVGGDSLFECCSEDIPQGTRHCSISKLYLEEIKEAVWDCGSSKAPGPDGYSFAFVKKYWGTIQKDLYDFVNLFFASCVMPNGANSLFFTLIPKVNNPTLITDFRPISLIGIHYKIIAKILANRLSKVIDKIVSKEQSAFIAGRQILDGPVILSEIIECFGFGNKWCSWIKACLNSSRASILINGSPTFEFSIKRGLKRGDPLSPFLFILVIEGLHNAFEEAVGNGLITGDIDIFIRVLHVFYLASGLKINIHKSNIYGIGVNKDEVLSMASNAGCIASDIPFNYLGYPIGSNMKIYLLAGRRLVDRVHMRLNLSSRGMDIPAISYSSCNANVESANHVFFECDIATDMWKLVFRWCDIPLFQASSWDSFNDWIISWHASKEKKHRFYVITTSVLWWLWRYRNSVTFNSQPLRKSDLFDNVRFSSFSWLHNRDHMKLSWNDWLMYPLSITRNGNG
ncbi:RNA-directed DNA polymerase, eukaryota [Tanacetum coccineum]